MEVFWTALLGIAGIAAAFFAPTWSSGKIEQRRERREFRRARRLVAHELAAGHEALGFILQEGELPPSRIEFGDLLRDTAFQSEQAVLATLLPTTSGYS